MEYRGQIVDVIGRRIFTGVVEVEDEKIKSITECSLQPDDDGKELPYIMPGFIDSHVHIESSMMVPAEFARAACEQGTIGIVTDPHEIANVLGIEGVDFMIKSGNNIRFNFCFGAPSCVPSCSQEFETSGAVLDSKTVDELMERPEIGFLSEMMNYPGVLANDPEVMAKIASARRRGKPVDGHAPGVTGAARRQYAHAGISTDHECSTIEEGRACIEAGMKLLVREGSAAKNYDALIPLLREYPDMIMFCTDDCHPSDLICGHINHIVKRALNDGYDLWDVLQAACVNPQRHYNLNWGLLQEGDPANFIVVGRIGPRLRVRKTIIRGKEIYDDNSYLRSIKSQRKSIQNQLEILDKYPNRFVAKPIKESDIQISLNKGDVADIIVAENGSLLTGHSKVEVMGNPIDDSRYPWHEVQKIVVYNRYTEGAKPVVGLIRGFNIQNGAMAASIAHDCHNIVAIGSNDDFIVKAINRVVEMKGGQVAISGEDIVDLALPIAGIISPLNVHEIAFRSKCLRETVASTGCPLKSPFITMSFMCLPVIPQLKLTDRGLFDVDHWKFI